jgi:hypothetical protein
MSSPESNATAGGGTFTARLGRRCSVARQSSGDTSKTEGMSRLSKLPAIIAQFALREMSSMA